MIADTRFCRFTWGIEMTCELWSSLIDPRRMISEMIYRLHSVPTTTRFDEEQDLTRLDCRASVWSYYAAGGRCACRQL